MDLETITHRAPQLWNLVPTEIKDAPSLSIFKEKIKSWHFDNCPCRLCKLTLPMQVLHNPQTSKFGSRHELFNVFCHFNA